MKNLLRPGVIVLLMVAIFVSLGAAIAKLLSNNISPFQALGYRGIFCGAGATALLMHAMELPVPLVRSRSTVVWSVGRGSCAAFGIGCFYFSLKYLPLSEAAVLFNCNPIFAFIFAKLFVGETATVLKVASIVINIAGAIVVVNPAELGRSSSTYSTGTLWFARGAVTFGAMLLGLGVVCMRKLATATHWAAPAWWQSVFSLLVTVIASAFDDFSPVPTDPPMTSAKTWLLICAIGFCGLFSMVGIGYAARVEDATTIAVLWNLDIALMIVWQLVMFPSEHVTWYQGLGVGLVIISSLMCALDDQVSAAKDEEDDTSTITTTVEHSHGAKKASILSSTNNARTEDRCREIAAQIAESGNIISSSRRLVSSQTPQQAEHNLLNETRHGGDGRSYSSIQTD